MQKCVGGERTSPGPEEKKNGKTRLRNASVEFFTSIGGGRGSLILEKSRLHLSRNIPLGYPCFLAVRLAARDFPRLIIKQRRDSLHGLFSTIDLRHTIRRISSKPSRKQRGSSKLLSDLATRYNVKVRDLRCTSRASNLSKLMTLLIMIM